MQFRSLGRTSLKILIAAIFVIACGSSDDASDDGASGSNAGGNSSGGAGGDGTSGSVSGGAGSGGTSSSGGGGTGGDAGSSSGGEAGTGGIGSGSAGEGGASGEAGSGGAGGTLPFELTSPAFVHNEQCNLDDLESCDEIPQANLLDMIGGANQSPELNWGPGPEGTLSYALVLHDYSNTFTHWALWNLPIMPTHLPAGLTEVPDGASQASFREGEGYAGPGAFSHVYEFRLYALNVASFTPGNPTDQGAVRAELESGANGAVLGTTDLRGKTPAQ